MTPTADTRTDHRADRQVDPAADAAAAGAPAPPRRPSRLTSTQAQIDDAELQAEVADAGADPIQQCQCGVPSTVVGRLRSVTLRPGDAVPAVEAQLWDGTGELTLVFLGRRRIAGISAGRSLVAHGRPIVRDGVRTMVNPRYELLPSGGE